MMIGIFKIIKSYKLRITVKKTIFFYFFLSLVPLTKAIAMEKELTNKERQFIKNSIHTQALLTAVFLREKKIERVAQLYINSMHNKALQKKQENNNRRFLRIIY